VVSINNVYAQNRVPPAQNTPRNSAGGQFNNDMFLQLLITQLRYQDPLSGNQDTGQLMTQLTLFTLLEQVSSLKQAVEAQSAAQEHQLALNLLNKEVTVLAEDRSPVRGVVTAVDYRGFEPLLTVNGAEFRLSALVLVEAADAARPAEGSV